MCPCQRAVGCITIANAAVSRFDALSDTEPHKDLFTSSRETANHDN
jgi:hypothetical protein